MLIKFTSKTGRSLLRLGERWFVTATKNRGKRSPLGEKSPVGISTQNEHRSRAQNPKTFSLLILVGALWTLRPPGNVNPVHLLAAPLPKMQFGATSCAKF